jgi:hypothetical protein
MVSITTAPAFLRGAIRWVRVEPALPDYTPSQREVVVRYVAAADQRIRCARDSALYPAVAAGLLRDALGFLTRATGIGREGHVSVDPVAALAELREAAARVKPEDFVRRIADALEASDPLYFDAMDAADLAPVVDALDEEAWWLRSRIDLRSPTYRAGARVGRMAGLAILGVWLLYALLHMLFRPKNLALSRPVRESSHQVGTPDPSGLVDGKFAPTYGLHTDVNQKDAWAIVDLEKPTPIRTIVVYNRSDQNFEDSLPLALDVSTDGVTFHEVARRNERFGDGSFLSPPWTARVHEYGKYVRVRSKRYIALNEIEVF